MLFKIAAQNQPIPCRFKFTYKSKGSMDAFASVSEQEPNFNNTKWKISGKKKVLSINHGLDETRTEGELFKVQNIFLAVESANGIKVEIEVEFDDTIRKFKMSKVKRDSDHPAEKAYSNPGTLEKFFKRDGS